jgi:hyaluronan synthase
MVRYSIKADRLYPWLLLAVVVSVVGMVAWQSLSMAHSSSQALPWLRLMKSSLGMSLTFVGILTLVWRICFAMRYKSYPPVQTAFLPTVSIIIPAFNEGSQILDTVRSVMTSRYPAKKLQVICVDDGSADDTWRWMVMAHKQFPKNVRLIRQPSNMGKRHALMAGFAQATGQVFVTIDSDSEVLPDTLRHLVSPFVADPRVGSVAGNVRVLNMDEGAIPKMMEVSFTSAFDFIRTGQSVYGGVFCTPGALSAYRAESLKPLLADWAVQTFMGKPANIGEDRALTNLVIASGLRVVYQRDAVVLTKVPVQFKGLRRMLLRWARSNVRENLVMFGFVFGRFRTNDSGSGWVRLFSITQMVRMTFTEAFKCAVMVQLILEPLGTLVVLATGAVLSAILPAIVHFLRHGGWFGLKWSLPFSFYWLVCLWWIPLWGIFTSTQSGWLTRGAPAKAPQFDPASVMAASAGVAQPKISARAA